jgi:hypothetical protein
MFFLPITFYGQEKLNNLTSPTSPASSVLGMQPKTILAPKSYQALEATLYSNFFNEDGGAMIPNDFALEFTPYWTNDHGLTIQEYLYPESVCEQIKRNSSFSLASTQNFILGDSSATNGLAYGYRTTIYFGNKNDRNTVDNFIKTLGQNEIFISRIAATAEGLLNPDEIDNKEDFIDLIKGKISLQLIESGYAKNNEEAILITDKICKQASELSNWDKNDPDPFLDSFYNLIDETLNGEKTFKEFESYIRQRQGLSIDLAYAGLINFPSNDFEYSIVPRQSLWITPTYRFKDNMNFLKFLGVLRYEWYSLDYYKKYFPTNTVYSNNIDYGLAVSLEFQKFSLQFELVGRSSNSEIPAGTDSEGNELFRKEKDNDLQYIGTFSYNLMKQVVLTYSLGNRFDPIQNPTSTLVSQLSLNFGFGTPTKEDLK